MPPVNFATIFALALEYAPQLINFVVTAVGGVEKTIAIIKASKTPDPAVQAALIATVRAGLAAEDARVQAMPIP